MRAAAGRPTDEAAQVLGQAAYFAELLDEWAQDGQANERLFRLGASVGEALCLAGSVDALARYFEYWLLRLQGVYQRSDRLSAEAQAFLEASRTCSPFRLGALAVSRAALREIEAAHCLQIAHHLEKDLKSVRVLKEMQREGAFQ